MNDKSLQDIENEIIDEFSVFDDWLDKYLCKILKMK